jgi:branched-subunit amino acid transport protein
LAAEIRMTFFLVMVACGLLTFLIRLSFIAAEGRLSPPGWFRAALPFVPVAALTALVAPDLLLREGHLHLIGNPRLYAGAVAIAVAWRFRNATLTIAAGFVALLVLHALLP